MSVRAEPRPPVFTGSGWHSLTSRHSIAAGTTLRSPAFAPQPPISTPATTDTDRSARSGISRGWRRAGPRPDRVASRPARRLASRISRGDLRRRGKLQRLIADRECRHGHDRPDGQGFLPTLRFLICGGGSEQDRRPVRPPSRRTARATTVVSSNRSGRLSPRKRSIAGIALKSPAKLGVVSVEPLGKEIEDVRHHHRDRRLHRRRSREP